MTGMQGRPCLLIKRSKPLLSSLAQPTVGQVDKWNLKDISIRIILTSTLSASPYYTHQHYMHHHITRINIIISEIPTWYFKSKGLATGVGKKCFGKSRGEPERMFPHRPKVPLEDQDFNRSDPH